MHMKMSRFVPEDVTSLFAETDSCFGEAVSTPFNSPLCPNPLAGIVVEEEAARRLVPECFPAKGETSDEEEVVDVGAVPARVRGGAQSEGFTCVDTLRGRETGIQF